MTSVSRVRFLFSSAAIAAIGLPLLTKLADAAATIDPADLQALNSSIELEAASMKVYNAAIATQLLSDKTVALASAFRDDHQAHLDALSGAVRASENTPSEQVAAIEYPALRTENAILAFARGIEEKAASTYLEIIPAFKNRDLAGIVASILGIETTHVALLAQVLGDFPAYTTGFVE